jgi:hypothetical protein
MALCAVPCPRLREVREWDLDCSADTGLQLHVVRHATVAQQRRQGRLPAIGHPNERHLVQRCVQGGLRPEREHGLCVRYGDDD